MLGSLKKYVASFAVLIGIGIGVISIFYGVPPDGFLFGKGAIYTTIVWVVLLAICSALLLSLCYVIAKCILPLTKRTMVWVAFKAVRKAIDSQTKTVDATAITPIEDDIGVGLALGSDNGVARGHRFVVLNAATLEKWGVLEAHTVHGRYCLCVVFDRINPDFWEGLERRMRSDPAPPTGVTIQREIPEEYLLDWLNMLLNTWRD